MIDLPTEQAQQLREAAATAIAAQYPKRLTATKPTSKPKGKLNKAPAGSK
jgi:hypothetical protein